MLTHLALSFLYLTTNVIMEQGSRWAYEVFANYYKLVNTPKSSIFQEGMFGVKDLLPINSLPETVEECLYIFY